MGRGANADWSGADGSRSDEARQEPKEGGMDKSEDSLVIANPEEGEESDTEMIKTNNPQDEF